MPTIEEYRKFLSRGKYGNIKTTYAGVVYDSRKEARRAQELDLLTKAGEIFSLEIQPKFPVFINDKKVFTYIADFAYTKKDGTSVVEDVKGVKTPVFNLKRKCVEAYYGITITII